MIKNKKTIYSIFIIFAISLLFIWKTGSFNNYLPFFITTDGWNKYEREINNEKIKEDIPVAEKDNNISESANKIDIQVMDEITARGIAEKSCIKGGEALSAGMYNKATKTWWFEANLNAAREGCNASCVVNENTRTADINWMCTGLKKPVDKQVACTLDAKECPDGSYVGRSGPNCEFICPL